VDDSDPPADLSWFACDGDSVLGPATTLLKQPDRPLLTFRPDRYIRAGLDEMRLMVTRANGPGCRSAAGRSLGDRMGDPAGRPATKGFPLLRPLPGGMGSGTGGHDPRRQTRWPTCVPPETRRLLAAADHEVSPRCPPFRPAWPRPRGPRHPVRCLTLRPQMRINGDDHRPSS